VAADTTPAPDGPVADTLNAAAKLCRDTEVLPPAIAGYLAPQFERWAAAPAYRSMTPQSAVVKAAREVLAAAERYMPRVQLAESVHPGEILREELKARGLTQLACAELAGRSVQVINLIINGKKGITPDTALDLERGLGVSAGFWVRLQAEHDLAVARQRRAVPR
jgi:addiction module HigA family antidote